MTFLSFYLLLSLYLLMILNKLLDVALNVVLLKYLSSPKPRRCRHCLVVAGLHNNLPAESGSAAILTLQFRGAGVVPESRARGPSGGLPLGRELGDLLGQLVDHFVCKADLFIKRELFVGVKVQPSEGQGLLELALRLHFRQLDLLDWLRGRSLFLFRRMLLLGD